MHQVTKLTQRQGLDLIKYFLGDLVRRLCGDIDVKLELGHVTKMKDVLGITYMLEDAEVSELGVNTASVTRDGSSSIFFRTTTENDGDERRPHIPSCVKVFLYSGGSAGTGRLLFSEYPSEASSGLTRGQGREDRLALVDR